SACEPTHVQYNYGDKSIELINTTNQARKNLKLSVRVYDINSKEKFSKVDSVDLPANTNLKSLVLPNIPDISGTFFLKLTLEDERRQLVSSNFYWLSTKDDEMDWQKSTWYYTPVSSYADMTQLQQLPTVKLNVSGTTVRRAAGEETARITVSNPS